MIPQGKYRAKATGGAEFGESKQKGSRYVRCEFVITDGDQKGQYVGWDGYFSGDAQQRTIESLRYAGCTFPSNDITNLEGLGSREVQIVVEHEDYTYPVGHEKAGQKTTRVRVAWVNNPGGIPEEQRMDDAKKRAFAASMKGAVMATRGKAPASPNGGKAAPGAGGWDGTGPDPNAGGAQDDIPF